MTSTIYCHYFAHFAHCSHTHDFATYLGAGIHHLPPRKVPQQGFCVNLDGCGATGHQTWFDELGSCHNLAHLRTIAVFWIRGN